MTVGLIGFGRLGMLLTRYFAADFKISVFDPKAKGAQIKKLGAKPATLAAAWRQLAVGEDSQASVRRGHFGVRI